MLKRLFLNDYIILGAIGINVLIIFLLYFPSLENNWWLEFIDHLFILFFIVEAIVKLKVLGRKGYFSSSWNRFDFFIVLGSIPVLFASYGNLPDTNLLVLLRLFRLVRVVRFIRFVPNIDSVLNGLGRALKASVFVLGALFFLLFLLALITCNFYAKLAPEYFGDPLMSLYSIFQLFTMEGWNEIPAAISENTDSAVTIGFTRFYFALLVLLGGIFGLSLANAVFVDEMTMDNNLELERKIDTLQSQIGELKEMLAQQAKEKEQAITEE
ncbi:MAG: ion transporter [Bacteroidota bacterium]